MNRCVPNTLQYKIYESSIQEILDSPDFRDPELELKESDSEEELEEKN